MATTAPTPDAITFTLKLAVNKCRNRVVFVESDKDFVEVLLCFLKVPLGSISRLCGKNSSVGSIDNLYRSVEDLEDKYFNTKACKNMLLWPKIKADLLCNSLKIYDTSFTDMYYCYNCSESYNCLESTLKVVPYEGIRCSTCGNEMKQKLDLSKSAMPPAAESTTNDHFIKGNMRFMFTDDMIITPSTSRRIMDLSHLTYQQGDKIEFEQINVGKEQIIQLLRQAFLNKMSFTSVFLGLINDGVQPTKLKKEDISPRTSSKSEEKKNIIMQKDVKQEDECAKTSSKSEVEEKTITISLLVDKKTLKVLYAECENDFVDLLVSFLTFPFGLVVDILRGEEELVDFGSFNNLYNSVDRLSSIDLMKDPVYKDMLMKPKLPPHFGVGTVLLNTSEEIEKLVSFCRSCQYISLNSSCSSHRFFLIPLIYMDPKKHGDISTDSQFMNKPAKYMVTDELVITPFCSITSFSLLNKAGFLPQFVEEKTFSIGEKEAKKLLKTCMTSKTPLTDAFLL